jgi:uncharacterized surface protein with fasciclin (FAS1) repeats
MDPAANLVGGRVCGLCREGSQRRRLGGRHGPRPGRSYRFQQPAAEDPDGSSVRQAQPEVDLVDTLNGSEFTVFAPVDDAFAKIDAATIETLKTANATVYLVDSVLMPK